MWNIDLVTQFLGCTTWFVMARIELEYRVRSLDKYLYVIDKLKKL